MENLLIVLFAGTIFEIDAFANNDQCEQAAAIYKAEIGEHMEPSASELMSHICLPINPIFNVEWSDG